MPVDTYDALPSTVLAYKKAHHIGRFDPNATEVQQRKVREAWEEIESKSERSFIPILLCLLPQHQKLYFVTRPTRAG